ncbi:unnamed protein product [Prorocentrum cordatum]|uniref:RNA helicase n=1 Tax=Prorocentrum cordatum TaxID=2364126 RepID=A0ABN9QZ59_9DINO|nr:unnamed protein product [Polarella glacialis]
MGGGQRPPWRHGQAPQQQPPRQLLRPSTAAGSGAAPASAIWKARAAWKRPAEAAGAGGPPQKKIRAVAPQAWGAAAAKRWAGGMVPKAKATPAQKQQAAAWQSSKSGKISKWGSKAWGGGGGASSWGGGGGKKQHGWGGGGQQKLSKWASKGQSSKGAKQQIASALKIANLAGALGAAKRAAAVRATAGAAGEALPKLLELAARKHGLTQYCEVMALLVQLDARVDVVTLTRLLVLLTARVPVPTGMVRLTLNLAVPADGQVVPVVPEGATEEEQQAVLEDGEPPAAAGEGGRPGQWLTPPVALPSAPAKEAGPRAPVKDAAEAREAHLALGRVKPEALRGRLAARDGRTAAYFGHFVTLLHLEALVELQGLKRRLQRPVEDLERFGHTIRALRAQDCTVKATSKTKGGGLPGKEGSTKKTRVALVLAPGTDAGRVRLRPGDSVLLSRSDPMKDLVGEGLVEEAPAAEEDGGGAAEKGGKGKSKGKAQQERIVLTLDGGLDTAKTMEGTWRIDKGANRTAYERQFQALVKMAIAKEEKRFPIWNLLSLTGVGGSNVDGWAARMRQMVDDRQEASLEAADHGGTGRAPQALSKRAAAAVDPRLSAELEAAGVDPAAAAELRRLAAEEPTPPGGSLQYLQRLRGELQRPDGADTNLNPSQRDAVAAALGRRLTLVQGPPGTGKTTVSVQLLRLWATRLWVKPLLATSDSNIAVDNIAEGCQQLGLKVVRVGRPEKVNSSLEEATLEHMLKRRRDEADKGSAKGGNEKTDKQRRLESFEAKMEILKSADVVCTTTVASGGDFLHLLKFGAILIDEVAQATELSAIVPVALRGSERLVLVGDHCQLPPSVCSMEAETRGLSLSVFGRLVAQGLQPHFLDTQFRMHPRIADFSAREFYHGRLKTGVEPHERPPPSGFAWPEAASGIAFLHVPGPERRDGESRANAGEVDAVADVLAGVLAAGELSVLEVGIVSPYAAQVRQLRQKLRRELPARLEGTGVDLTGGLEGRRGAQALEIASVDAFQGREKELIIFSAVRSNRQGNVGFLADWRRLNVTITRARRGLIVVGDTATLRGNATWARWLDWAQELGLVVGAPGGGGGGGWALPSAPPPQQRWPTPPSPAPSQGAWPQRNSGSAGAREEAAGAAGGQGGGSWDAAEEEWPAGAGGVGGGLPAAAAPWPPGRMAAGAPSAGGRPPHPRPRPSGGAAPRPTASLAGQWSGKGGWAPRPRAAGEPGAIRGLPEEPRALEHLYGRPTSPLSVQAKGSCTCSRGPSSGARGARLHCQQARATRLP